MAPRRTRRDDESFYPQISQMAQIDLEWMNMIGIAWFRHGGLLAMTEGNKLQKVETL